MNRKKVLLYVGIAGVLLGAIAIGILLLRPAQAVFYKVTFQDFDGTVLKTESVEAGKAATPPEDPQRNGYTFVGWNRDFSSVDKDMVITAEYLRITDTTFVVETVTINQGTEHATVHVSVESNPGFLGMVLSVSYDEDALMLISCSNGMALSALAFQEPATYKSGSNFVWYGSETGEVMDGEILALTFDIADDAKPGTYPITISWSDRDIYDSNCDMVDPDVTQGAIVIR